MNVSNQTKVDVQRGETRTHMSRNANTNANMNMNTNMSTGGDATIESVEPIEMIAPELEALLRDYFEPPVGEDGFSQHLMAQLRSLPTSNAQRKTRVYLPLIAFSLGLCSLLWQLMSSTFFQRAFQQWGQGRMSEGVWWLIAVGGGLSLSVSYWVLSESD